jgi:hypothetical protein
MNRIPASTGVNRKADSNFSDKPKSNGRLRFFWLKSREMLHEDDQHKAIPAQQPPV